MLATYDPRQVLIAFGAFPIVGFADGTFVKIVRNNDMWTEVVGASGETARAKSNDRSGLATITLLQTSPSNLVLSKLALQDEAFNTGVRPFLVKDGLGASIMFSAVGYVKKLADAEFGKDISTREWTLFLADCTVFSGGNVSI